MASEQYKVLYEGISKMVCEADSPERVILHFKDTTSAYNNIKKATIKGKGEICCKISSFIFNYLNMNGLKTHFIAMQSPCDQLCTKVEIIPVEFAVRNYIAGTLARRLKMEEGFKPGNLIVELSYKNRGLGVPFISEDLAVALDLMSYEELSKAREIIVKANALLTDLFAKAGIKLIDFKAFFGRTSSGELILANEISPETARLWDIETEEKLDKDRFRRDMDDVAISYNKIYERLTSLEI